MIRLVFTLVLIAISIHLAPAQTTPVHYYFNDPFGGITNSILAHPDIRRGQFIYRAEDFQEMVSPVNDPIEIDTIFVRYGGGGDEGFFPYEYTNLQVTLAHTTLEQPTTVFADNFTIDPGQVVIDAATFNVNYYSYGSFGPGGSIAEGYWTAIPLETPFNYNGTDNLLIDWSYDAVSFPATSGGLQMDFSVSNVYAVVAFAGNTEADFTLSRPYFGVNPVSCPTQSSLLAVELCPGDTYDFNGTLLDAPGTYIDTLQTADGCDSLVTLELSSTFSISLTTVSSFGDFAVSCADASDGWIAAAASGGTAPFTYQWNTGATDPNLGDIPAGTYVVTITDGTGCAVSDSVTLVAPPSLEVEVAVTDPDCAGLNTGEIELSAAGGVEPYVYGLNYLPLGTESVFTNLGPGVYSLTVSDANDCTQNLEAELMAPPPAIFSVEPESAILDLGESLTLSVFAPDIVPGSLQWSPATTISCTNCPSPVVTPPQTTTYTVTALLEGGCPLEARVTVEVQPRRGVYVPNIFSPDNDGVNDRFSVFGGPEVSSIRSMQIYDRWGELVYTAEGLLPNDTNRGWDGTMRGQPAATGTYVYWAEVEFLDGETVIIKGDVTLIR